MKDEQRYFLTLVRRPPARFTPEQTAWVLNCQPYDIPVLVASRLLKPLGNPQPNGLKFFAAAEVLELASDRAWLAKMTNAIQLYWHRKNERRSVNYLSPETLQTLSKTRSASL